MGTFVFPRPLMFGACLLGSLLPDLDHPGSLIGRKFSFFSKLTHRSLGHRGALHSLLALLGWFWGLAWLFPKPLALAFLGGYGSHLVLDAMTKGGFPIFWPFSLKTGGAGLKSGGWMDGAIGLISVVIVLWRMGQSGIFLEFMKTVKLRLGVLG